MNFAKTLIVMGVLLMSACDFQVPLSASNIIPIDNSALGIWQLVNEKEEPAEADVVTILRFSDTEYLLQHTSNGSSIYFRAYLIDVADRILLQAEVIGGEEGPPKESYKELFSVITYTIEDDELIFSSLNTELIDTGISSREVLKDAFVKEKDNPDLFTDQTRYRRVLP